MRGPAELAGVACACAVSLAVTASAGPTETAGSLRVMSLDQCADQYVLALSPRRTIVGLSTRARQSDSWLAALAAGLPIRRADRESTLAAQPRVVIRFWGGAPELVAELERRGTRVTTIRDATDFAGIRRNVRAVASALRQDAAGEALIARMDAKLVASAGAWHDRSALYQTPGGATAGRGTLIDTILRAAGLRNLSTRKGYQEISLEHLVMNPPSAVVRGFFDTPSQTHAYWGPGRNVVLSRLTSNRSLISLPGAWLGCPAWFAADAVQALAAAAPRRCERTATGENSPCV
jgi:iron complex transport system substrate-binding protein